MATQYGAFSFTIRDELGVAKAYDDYFSYDDATATLSSLGSYAQATAVLLDAITDGVLITIKMKLGVTLPGGIKTVAEVGSDVEETGLFTYNTDNPAGRAFGEDIPAIKQALLVGKNITVASGAGQSWVNHQINHALAGDPMDDKYSGHMLSIRTALKTFRKSRRALKRA